MDGLDLTPMQSTRAIDALIASGFGDQAIRSIVSQWMTWGQFASASPHQRMRIAGVTGRFPVPSRCPMLRGPSFGHVVSYLDAQWPRSVEALLDPPSLIETSCRDLVNAVAVIGATHPSHSGVLAATSVARRSAEAGYAVVAIDVGVGMHALRGVRAVHGRSCAVLYGDGMDDGYGGVRGSWTRSRETHGGARSRFETGGEPPHGAVHLRGTSSGAAGMLRALSVAVAVSHTVYVIEPGIGRFHGSEPVRLARELGKRVITIAGEHDRSERSPSPGESTVHVHQL